MSYPSDPISDSDLIDGLDVRYLKICGLWGVINHYRTTGTRNTFFKIVFIIDALIQLPSIILQEFVVFFYVPVDMQKFTVINSHIAPCAHTLGRFIIIWLQMDSIAELFNLFKRDFLTTIPENKQSHVSKMYKNVSVHLNLLVKTIMTCNVMLILMVSCFPGFPVEYVEHGTGKLELNSATVFKILGGWYPCPMSESPYYEYIFVYELVFMVFDCLWAATFLCLFIEPLICLSTHFRVLGYHISTLKVGAEYGYNGSADSDIYKQLYIALLIRYANKLKEVYNPAITMTLGLAIAVQVICIFQALFGGVDDTFYKVRFIQLAIFVASEVSVYCYGSTLLQEASADLRLAVYSSEWYKADRKYQKMARMIMTESSKGITLVAVKMYPINLETMVNLFQFTYTVATLMSHMVE